MKYICEFHDGEDWVPMLEAEFDTPQEARQFGIDAGFDYVRVVSAPGPENRDWKKSKEDGKI